MGSGIYVAVSGAVAQSNALDVTANNIANASTAGFQGTRVSFQEALASARSVDIALVGNTTVGVDQQAGTMSQTGNPLDLALDGDGYLAVDTAAGVRYTRAGALQMDPVGTLITADGHPLRGQGGGPIAIPEGTTQIMIGENGSVSADGAEIGRLDLARFEPGAMRREGSTLMSARGPRLDGDPPRVLQGAIEGSNVNIVRGVVDLVKVSRTYESLLRLIEGFNQVESRAARDLGGPK